MAAPIAHPAIVEAAGFLSSRRAQGRVVIAGIPGKEGRR
jgi:hypothetical protein